MKDVSTSFEAGNSDTVEVKETRSLVNGVTKPVDAGNCDTVDVEETRSLVNGVTTPVDGRLSRDEELDLCLSSAESTGADDEFPTVARPAESDVIPAIAVQSSAESLKVHDIKSEPIDNETVVRCDVACESVSVDEPRETMKTENDESDCEQEDSVDTPSSERSTSAAEDVVKLEDGGPIDAMVDAEESDAQESDVPDNVDKPVTAHVQEVDSDAPELEPEKLTSDTEVLNLDVKHEESATMPVPYSDEPEISTDPKQVQRNSDDDIAKTEPENREFETERTVEDPEVDLVKCVEPLEAKEIADEHVDAPVGSAVKAEPGCTVEKPLNTAGSVENLTDTAEEAFDNAEKHMDMAEVVDSAGKCVDCTDDAIGIAEELMDTAETVDSAEKPVDKTGEVIDIAEESMDTAEAADNAEKPVDVADDLKESKSTGVQSEQKELLVLTKLDTDVAVEDSDSKECLELSTEPALDKPAESVLSTEQIGDEQSEPVLSAEQIGDEQSEPVLSAEQIGEEPSESVLSTEQMGDKQSESVLSTDQMGDEQLETALPTEISEGEQSDSVLATETPSSSELEELEKVTTEDGHDSAIASGSSELEELATEEEPLDSAVPTVEPPSSNDVDSQDTVTDDVDDIEMIDLSSESQQSADQIAPTSDTVDEESTKMETDDAATTKEDSSCSSVDEIKDILRSSLKVCSRDGGKDEPSGDVTLNGLLGRKRLSDSRSVLLEPKKVRMNSPITTATVKTDDALHNGTDTAKCETAVNGDADVSNGNPRLPVKRKAPSNLDRAIDRVASGGKKKRQREIGEILKQIDVKAPVDLTSGDVEEVMLHLILEAITQRSDVGHLRDMISTLSTSVKKWRSNSTNLAKQVRDMQLVVKRMAADGKQTGQISAPIKVTRSVGLQVGTPPGYVPPASAAAPPAAKPNPVRPSVPVARRAGGIITNRSTPSPQPNATPPKQPPTAGRVPGAGVSVLAESVLKSPPNKVTAPAASASRLSQPTGVRTFQTRTSSGRQVSNLIDLTDEDDRAKTNGSAVPSPNTVRIVNHIPSAIPGNTIRLVPPSQLTGKPTPNGPAPRLTYVVPSSAVPVGPKTVFFSSSTQQPGVNNLTTRPPAKYIPRPGAAATSSGAQPATVARLSQPGVRRAGPGIGTPARPVYRQVAQPGSSMHPAPLPPAPQFFMPIEGSTWKMAPPQPELKISKCDNRQQGIILSWKMDSYSDRHEAIANYQLYAYQETSSPPNTASWKRVGEVKSMALPMACTLTQFSVGNTYHFAVRALDIKGRTGPFSLPGSILLPSE